MGNSCANLARRLWRLRKRAKGVNVINNRKPNPMKIAFALAAAALLGACSSMHSATCVQPDPVQPSSGCWNQGLDCGTNIQTNTK